MQQGRRRRCEQHSRLPQGWRRTADTCGEQRDAAGAGASSAHVSRHVGTLARVELSSSLVADHSLAEYGEALETLALRAGAKTSPRVEVAGPLEWREVNPHVDRLNRNAPLVAALGGFAVSGPIGAIAAGGAAMYAANQRGARDAAKEALERNASRWTSREKCFVLAHETCLKIESAEPGELRPTKIQLFFGNDAKRRFAVRLVESGDPGDSGDSGDGEDAIGGESVIEIYEPEDEADGEAIRVRVPGGGATYPSGMETSPVATPPGTVPSATSCIHCLHRTRRV